MSFSTEQQLEHAFPLLQDFWQQQSKAGTFKAKDGLSIAYCVVSPLQANGKAIVISSGRTETYLKYQELAFDLCHLGYTLYFIDHRGQGLSGRECANPQLGYVSDYQDYVDDFSLFMQQQVLPQQHTQLYLLAHSMGGTIACLYMLQYPQIFTAAALLAPMLSIQMNGLPIPLAHKAAWLLDEINKRWGGGAAYGPGQHSYQPRSFAENELSHSAIRYQRLLEVYQQYPQVQLGGPTNAWLLASFRAMATIITSSAAIKTPLLLLQAEQDRIVSAYGQNRFCQLKAAAGTPCHGKNAQLINGARHEILFETDAIRIPALTKITEFFASQQG